MLHKRCEVLMSAGWSFGYNRRYWLETASLPTMSTFFIDYVLAGFFHKVMRCNNMGEIFQNNSNVHVCSLARASYAPSLLSNMRRILITLKIYDIRNNDSKCVKWFRNACMSQDMVRVSAAVCFSEIGWKTLFCC